jgi:hypothetical protein
MMTKSEREALERCTGIHKEVRFKRKGESSKYLLGTVVDEVSVIVDDYKHLIQRIKLDPSTYGANKYAYRTAYYTLSAKEHRPVWGQYHGLVFETDFRKLLRKAHKKGWLGLSKV